MLFMTKRYPNTMLAFSNTNLFYYFFFRTSCKAVGRLAGVEGTDVYCHRNCLRYPSNCPEDECQCTDKPAAGGEDHQDTSSNIVQAPPSPSPSNLPSYREYPGNPVEVEPGIIIL